ncbi:tryptophan synthase subunit beta [Candidatus Mycalebacterium sp.]
MNKEGFFGDFGGRFVSETLMPPLIELEEAYNKAKSDPDFTNVVSKCLADFAGRPTPLYFAERMTKKLGGARIYLKREDLAHTGAHKINNTIGQITLADRMGKNRIIAETGAGQHGVATATVAALFGKKCEVYMGRKDTERQKMNLLRMRTLGAEIHPVDTGSATLKDALNEAMRDWITNVEDTFYVIGSVAGPHPYPTMVRDFQSVIGAEVKEQLAYAGVGKPNLLVACVGGGSNAAGLFHPFIEDSEVAKVGVEAGGEGLEPGNNSATITQGSQGVLHGSRTFVLQDDDGQINKAHSIAAGLDYPGVGPEHSFFHDTGLAEYTSVSDDEALEAFYFLSKTEGIIPALESAHAVSYVMKVATDMPASAAVVVCLSGRGDKDLDIVAQRTDG